LFVIRFAGVLETENEEDRVAIRKAKTLYSSCMNESKDRHSLQPSFAIKLDISLKYKT
jgi:hypothetical protein